ncbi:XkdX family protein [Paenibacillus sp. FSL E2-0274]|jgi:hypothetical protein|nr:XkdX family protein [Paenibacillus odorifer]
MFNNDFERLSYYYAKKWAKETQLRQYVAYNVITPAEFTEITGVEYEA